MGSFCSVAAAIVNGWVEGCGIREVVGGGGGKGKRRVESRGESGEWVEGGIVATSRLKTALEGGRSAWSGCVNSDAKGSLAFFFFHSRMMTYCLDSLYQTNSVSATVRVELT